MARFAGPRLATVLGQAWLERQGIDSRVDVEELGLRRVVGRLRVGPEAVPDLAADRVEIEIEIAFDWPWSSGPFIAPTSIHLVRPELRARLDEGRLELGELDDLVEALRSESSEPQAPVHVDDASVVIDTGGGIVQLRGQGTLSSSRVLQASASIGPTRVEVDGSWVELAGGELAIQTTEESTHLDLDLQLEGLEGSELSARGIRTELDGVLVHRALPWGLGARALTLTGSGSARSITVAGANARDAELALSFFGVFNRGLAGFTVDGSTTFRATAKQLEAGGSTSDAATVHAVAPAVHFLAGRDGFRAAVRGWAGLTSTHAQTGAIVADALRLELSDAQLRLDADRGVEASSNMLVQIGEVEREGLRLRDMHFSGSTRSSFVDAPRVRIEGALLAEHGSWQPPAHERRVRPRSSPLTRALADFRIEAPELTVELADDGTRLGLPTPARLEPGTGGAFLVSARRGQAVYRGAQGRGQGAFDLRGRGGGLPTLRVGVPHYTLEERDGAWTFEGRAGGKVVVSAGPLRTGVFEGAGTLQVTEDRARFSSSRCVDVKGEQLGEGTAALFGLAGTFCPDGEPLLTYGPDGWSFVGLASNASARAPELGLRVQAARGPVRGTFGAGAPSLELEVHASEIIDERDRFEPMQGAGFVGLLAHRWVGAMDVFKGGRRVARLDAHHDALSESGTLEIDARGLQFEPQGVQLADLTPVARTLVASPIRGIVDAWGIFDWDASGSRSRGRVRTGGLDFASPIGTVRGLAADVALTSLAPLITAKGQTVTARELAGPIVIGDAQADISLTDDVLRVDEGKFSALQGRASVDPLVIPLNGNKSWRGSVRFADMELQSLVEKSSVADRFEFQGKVDGTLHFSHGPQGARITGGRFVGSEPGRLSIDPSLMSEGSEGFEAQAQSEGLSSIALQALQHLAFERLDGRITSTPDGRLGVSFEVKGHHDPPQHQEIEISWIDLIRRRFDDDLPLPSGTEVELTLDTLWKMDGLPQRSGSEPQSTLPNEGTRRHR